MATTTVGRMSREARRTQLVTIGLRMLERVPFHSLSVDVVAEKAGISRSLLFHYFPTKTDYLVAVVRAATEHVLVLTEVPDSVTSPDQTRSIVSAFVRYIQTRRANYVAVIRCAPAVDPALEAVIDEMHETLCLRALTSLGFVDPDVVTLVAARGWLAALEEIAVLATDGRLPQSQVVHYGVTSLHAYLTSPRFREMFGEAPETTG